MTPGRGLVPIRRVKKSQARGETGTSSQVSIFRVEAVLVSAVVYQVPGRARLEGGAGRLRDEMVVSLFNPYSMVKRKVVDFLHQPARPADGCLYRALGFTQPEEQFLAVLGQKS